PPFDPGDGPLFDRSERFMETGEVRRVRWHEELFARLGVDHRLGPEVVIERVSRLDEGARALADGGDRKAQLVLVDGVEAARLQERRDALHVLVVAREARRLEVLVLDGDELLLIELPVGAPAVLPAERLDELLEREDLLIAVRPAEAREVVE